MKVNRRLVRKLMFIILFFSFLFLIWNIYREIGSSPSKEQLACFEKLPYFYNGCFHNSHSVQVLLQKKYKNIMLLPALLFTKAFAPKTELPVIPLNRESFKNISNDFAFYWLGHSSAILELNGRRIGIDLVFGNASPIPFTIPRYQSSPLAMEELPKLDYIIYTHNHYDHLERKTVTSIKKGHFIVPLGVGETLRGWGIHADRITELGWGDIFEQDGLKIIAVESQHFSGRGFNDRNLSLWCSYIIETSNNRIFWGGDTGYGKHFTEISKKYGPFKFCALEIDAWNDGWPYIHLFPEQTIQAAEDLKADFVFPIHWGVYALGFHHWRESIGRFIQLSSGKTFQVVTPKMGERCSPGKTKTSHWWQNVR